MEETRALLEQEKSQKVGHVLATPHFYAGKDTAERFFRRREEALAAVRVLSGELRDLPEIRAAAEVYYFPHMWEADILPYLCMEGSRVLLLEMPFVQWTDEVYRDVERIIRKRGLTVVLAHVERYIGYQKDRGVWEAVFDLPVYAQVNAGSLLRLRSRGFVLKFMKAGHRVLLGSDCHSPEYRPANLAAGREVLRKKLGAEALGRIDRLGEELWNHA